MNILNVLWRNTFRLIEFLEISLSLIQTWLRVLKTFRALYRWGCIANLTKILYIHVSRHAEFLFGWQFVWVYITATQFQIPKWELKINWSDKTLQQLGNRFILSLFSANDIWKHCCQRKYCSNWAIFCFGNILSLNIYSYPLSIHINQWSDIIFHHLALLLDHLSRRLKVIYSDHLMSVVRRPSSVVRRPSSVVRCRPSLTFSLNINSS